MYIGLYTSIKTKAISSDFLQTQYEVKITTILLGLYYVVTEQILMNAGNSQLQVAFPFSLLHLLCACHFRHKTQQTNGWFANCLSLQLQDVKRMPGNLGFSKVTNIERYLPHSSNPCKKILENFANRCQGFQSSFCLQDQDLIH